MTLIEKDAKATIDFTDCADVHIGGMFVIDSTVFMKVRDKSNNINYIDLSSGEEYAAYEIMQSFKGYKYARKVDGEMKWWRV